MWGRLVAAWERRRRAAREAEALVWRFGSRASGVARSFGAGPGADGRQRDHYARVARLAERRHRELQQLDVATRYAECARWQRSRAGEGGQ
jgi:hypothetical protein